MVVFVSKHNFCLFGAADHVQKMSFTAVLRGLCWPLAVVNFRTAGRAAVCMIRGIGGNERPEVGCE